MRSDHLRALLEAFVKKDDVKFIQVANEMVEEEERKNHQLLAKDLKEILLKATIGPNRLDTSIEKNKRNLSIPRDMAKGFPLVQIQEPHLYLSDAILAPELVTSINMLIQEIKLKDIIKSYGLKPRQKFLFFGPPGTGKTLTAHIISSILQWPLVTVRFESVISSFLGETATNIRRIFDFIENGEWVVLFDEFDIIGKNRDDANEHGEIKRVVNNLIQMIDNFRGDAIIIAATNHEQLLDPAVWRRFDDVLHFDLPDASRRKQILEKYLHNYPGWHALDLDEFTSITNGFSPADIARACEDALRIAIVNNEVNITAEQIYVAIERQQHRIELNLH